MQAGTRVTLGPAFGIMSQSKPTVRGDYVRIRGNLHRVTGKRQAERVRDILDQGHTAPITRWDGEQWIETGLVLHGSRIGSASQ